MKLTETASTELISPEVYDLCKTHLDAFIKTKNPAELMIYRGFDLSDTELFNEPRGGVILQGYAGRTRKPVHTPRAIHDIFDKIFEELTGHKLRSEAVFVTNQISQSAMYGTSFCILLPNAFNLIWLENIEDLFLRVGRFIQHDVPVIDPRIPKLNRMQELYDLSDEYQNVIFQIVEKEFRKIIPKEIRRITSIDQLRQYTTNRTAEGMLVCDSYARVSPSDLLMWRSTKKQ